MIAPSLKWRVDSATAWFYILTGLCIMVTCLAAGLGMQVLDKLHGGLTEAQVALAWAILLGLVLQCGICTLLVMIFYDPKRRAA